MAWLMVTQRGQRILVNTAHVAAVRDHGDRTIFVLAGVERGGLRELWAEVPFETVAAVIGREETCHDLSRPVTAAGPGESR